MLPCGLVGSKVGLAAAGGIFACSAANGVVGMCCFYHCRHLQHIKYWLYESNINKQYEIQMNEPIFKTFNEEYIHNTQKIWDILEIHVLSSLVRSDNNTFSSLAVLKIEKTMTSVSLIIDKIYVTAICCSVFLGKRETFEIQITMKLPSNEPFSEGSEERQVKYNVTATSSNIQKTKIDFTSFTPYWRIVFPNLNDDIWNYHVEPYVSIKDKQLLNTAFDSFVAYSIQKCQTTQNTLNEASNHEMRGQTMK